MLVAGVVATGLALGVAYAWLRGDTDGDATPRKPPAGAEAGATGDLNGELATDEDRIVALLEREDGRTRQVAIADRVDWSDSKTSRVLSDMAEQGTVEKLRIGQENVIDLRDSEDG
ncbi:hypothetical protein BRC62_08215 [Halobacteriales archaeon QH_10_67_13]|nr:MAG: hypothetical protein BRC62_08215 [Halobacteriales archaeon QH_10_67_13]